MKKYKNKTLILLFLFLPFILFANEEEEKDKAGKYISEGMTAYSTEDYTQAIELFKKAFISRPDYSALAYNISCCYALQHEKDSAITWLEKAIELGAYKFSDDEDFASLKKDKRFQELEKIAEQKIKELESKEWVPIIVLPEEFKEENQYPIVIALHGFGGNPVNLSKTLEPGVRPLDFILCCPYGSEVGGSTSFSWGDYEVSEKRIKKAHDTYEQRKGNNQDLSLLECLQLCDKRDLLAKSEDFRKEFNFSRNQFDSFVKQVEEIRNELAHSQNSIISNIEWPVFVETVSRLEDFLIRSDIKVEKIATKGNDFEDLLLPSV